MIKGATQTDRSVSEIVALATMWLPHDDQWLTELPFDGVSREGVLLSEQQIAQRHPLLPALLKTVLEHNQRRYFTHEIAGCTINDTLQHWEHPAAFNDMDGTFWYLLHVNAIHPCPDNADESVLLQAWTYTPVNACTLQTSSAHLPPDTSCVLNTAYGPRTVNIDELERLYPGWRERHAVAKTLGYTGKELAQLVCQPTLSVVPATTLPLDMSAVLTP